MVPELFLRTVAAGQIETPGQAAWRLFMPPGPAGTYRGSQLDNYFVLPRTRFLHHTPLRLDLRARVSGADLPGTWGFGLWNDPFGVGLGMGGAAARLPALPNAAWFFHASPNYLALRDDHPAQGFLAGTFRSPRIPSALLLAGAPAAALLLWRPAARWLRRRAASIVHEDALRLDLDVCAWHSYSLEWLDEVVLFQVDEFLVFETPVSPRGRMGLVIWIDNQFAAFGPDGRLRHGTLACPREAWLDIQDLNLS